MKSKKLLFIINETNNTELDNLNFNKNDFFIINLSNNKHPQSNYNYFQKKIYYDLYNNSFLKYNSTKKFIKKINTNKYFKYLKFSEMNLSDFFWKNYVYYVISTIKNNKCYFMREGKVKKLNNNFFFFVKPLISKQLILKLSIIKILNFLNDFLITIFSILFIKKKIVPKKNRYYYSP